MAILAVPFVFFKGVYPQAYTGEGLEHSFKLGYVLNIAVRFIDSFRQKLLDSRR